MNIPPELIHAWEWFSKEMTSASSTWLQTLVAGTIGAAAGSLATQSVISSNDRVRAAQTELRAVNRAISICFSITNHYLAFKKQLSRPMVERYKASRQIVSAALASHAAKIEVQFDLITLPGANMPIERLEQLMLDQIAMGGMGLVAAMQLRGAHTSLQEALAERARLIGAIQSMKLASDVLTKVYFGFPDSGGNVDDRFQNSVTAIERYTDDCIFFSNLIGKELHEYGLKLFRKHGRKLGTPKRSLDRFDWDDRAEGLMPDPGEYQSWLKGFAKRRPWWQFWKPEFVPHDDSVGKPTP